MALSHLTQSRQKTLGRRNHPHVAGHRFNDHCGDVLAVFLEQPLNIIQVVKWHHHRVLGHFLGNT